MAPFLCLLRSTHCAICACITFFWCIYSDARSHSHLLDQNCYLPNRRKIFLFCFSTSCSQLVKYLHDITPTKKDGEKQLVPAPRFACKHGLSRHHPIIKQAPKWLSPFRSMRLSFSLHACTNLLLVHASELPFPRSCKLGNEFGYIPQGGFMYVNVAYVLGKVTWLYPLFEFEMNIWIPTTILLGQLCRLRERKGFAGLSPSPKSFILLSWVWRRCCYFSTPFFPKKCKSNLFYTIHSIKFDQFYKINKYLYL
jgi:hypothetical protein